MTSRHVFSKFKASCTTAWRPSFPEIDPLMQVCRLHSSRLVRSYMAGKLPIAVTWSANPEKKRGGEGHDRIPEQVHPRHPQIYELQLVRLLPV